MKIKIKHVPILSEAAMRDNELYGNAYIEIQRTRCTHDYLKYHAALGWTVASLGLLSSFLRSFHDTIISANWDGWLFGVALFCGVFNAIYSFILK